MTSALNSHFGLAKQVAFGTPITTDNMFQYLFFSQGNGVEPMPVVLPLDQEIGSGPLIRSLKRVAVSSGGSIDFIPRPESIGHLLLGALGAVSTTTGVNFNTHTFKFAANQFETPYFTTRRVTEAYGVGDVASDVRVAALQFNFQAANFLRASAQFIGAGAPSFVDDTTAWAPASYLDETPEFLTCKGSVELPDGTALEALGGSVSIIDNIPMQEQFGVGRLTPFGVDIVSRSITFDLLVRANEAMYKKAVYDPAGGTAWATGILAEADIDVKFQTSEDVATGQPYQISFHANGQNEASGEANIKWAVAPLPLRGNRQVTMRMIGTVVADVSSNADGPFSVQLINGKASY